MTLEDIDADEASEDPDDDVVSRDHERIEIAVPPNLLTAWEHRAEQAKLSVSEYVVRMTEAGRMSVQMQAGASSGERSPMSVEQLRDEIVAHLRREEAVDWPGLVDAITSTLEEDIERALDGLQKDDAVRYSGLEGGYRLVEDDG